MSVKSRYDLAYRRAKVLEFDDRSRFIFLSDCHRGDNSFADEFANNRNIYYHALQVYYKKGFTYCELGDGDELWENLSFEPIFESHKNVFMLIREFHRDNRYFPIYGNHDMAYRDPDRVRRNYNTRFDPEKRREVPFMPGLEYTESIVLKHRDSGQEIFLVHGHQADWWNYLFWRMSRFMVRVLWKPLQVVGISDPTSPAKNNRESIRQEKRTERWIAEKGNLFTITGHTHRPRFPEPGELPLFNDGSCVHPRSITGIELEEGQLSLIKWYVDITEEGFLQIKREVLEGPTRLEDYQTSAI
ncbi:metallophosphoesterase [Robertkochia aurantiaca]|uniref:metallophosphoesterase n=1 Tax=Robertkochia aurantiaca TaxID=2873700 RepID=UPI001CC93C9A|nr:metallophosphoesterase [Robertkochia sp. 3YJGBD-33]